MKIDFFKYQGTGNDFVIIDNRDKQLNLDQKTVEFLCHRRFGIGADGLMLLQNKPGYDFEMIYHNSDGQRATMCGNGGRCIVAFAKRLNIFGSETKFWAADGEHLANVIYEDENETIVQLAMKNVNEIKKHGKGYFLDTGSPHYVEFTDNVDNIDIYNLGKEIRYINNFKPIGGTNVNFVQDFGSYISVRTYERGVEDETFSCGTGVTASALAYGSEKDIHEIDIKTKGGKLNVRFQKMNDTFFDIWLQGETKFVFKGSISI